jgi:beta-galactosidase
MGGNAWRTAHNPPNPALLDAADRLGFLVWDENHRNGQDDELRRLVLRDRNHPSVVLWSICNEKLCDSKATRADAVRLHDAFHALDPLGGRLVSANYNGWLGPDTPLDVQGVDYATSRYDSVHKAAPHLPVISSETSSAVSDRGEYANNKSSGHVRGYDTERPSWGQTAEAAWGGVDEPQAQGILTRPGVMGGFTWTGWDYKGEPTGPTIGYGWPDVNSHFGILDIAGFEKDRFYWYLAHFPSYKPGEGVLHLFPHVQQVENGLHPS